MTESKLDYIDTVEIAAAISQLAVEALQGKVKTRDIPCTIQVPDALCKVFEKGLSTDQSLEDLVSKLASQGIANHINDLIRQGVGGARPQAEPVNPSVPSAAMASGGDLAALGKMLGIDTSGLQSTLGKFQEVIEQLDQTVQQADSSVPRNLNQTKTDPDSD